MKILIAEDQNLIRQGLKKIISEIPGVDVTEAADGLQAWEMYRRCPADLIITDIVMPDMDGLELIGRIRQYDDRCVAVVISGYDKFDYAQRAMMYGVRDYLLKPMRREKILSVLKMRKDEFERQEEGMNRLFLSAWNAGLTGEASRETLKGVRFCADGELLVAKSTLSACPQAEETGYTLCRRLAELSENTAIFIANGTFSAQLRGEHLITESIPVKKDQEMIGAVRQLAEKWQLGGGNEHDEAVRRVLVYVNRHYGEPLSLQSVAEKVGLHPNYLSALFTRNMQCGFTHYLQRLRVEKSKTLLRTTNRKISDIASCLGFTDGKYFTKVFKSLAGVTPQQYRAGMSEIQMSGEEDRNQ